MVTTPKPKPKNINKELNHIRILRELKKSYDSFEEILILSVLLLGLVAVISVPIQSIYYLITG